MALPNVDLTGDLETWRLIDVRIAAHRSWDGEQKHFQTIIRCIKEILQEDHHRRAAKAGSEVESLLASDPPLIRELWIRMRGWNKAATSAPCPQPE